VSREITISLFRAVLSEIGLRGRREYSMTWDNTPRYNIPWELDWGHNEGNVQAHTYTYTNVIIVCARREINRLFVDRRMTNCFGIRFLRELCARGYSHSFRRVSAEVIPLLKRFHPPCISICIRLKRFICHRGVVVYFHTDVLCFRFASDYADFTVIKDFRETQLEMANVSVT